MKHQARALVIAAVGLGPLLLAAGCGSEETGARTTLANIQPTSFVTIEPATTTTTIAVTTTIAEGTSPEAQTYTVQPGDYVYKIASLFDVDPEVLATYNSWPEGVQHPLFAGDVVNIPPGAAIPGATGSGAVASGDTGDDSGDDTSPSTGCTHVIEAGENPTRVANEYDLTFDQLQAANPGMDFRTTFVVGDVLTIPPEGDCS